MVVGFYASMKKPFVQKLEKNIKKIHDRLDEYITDPDIDNIHDIRIAIRRLIASYLLLPKSTRKKQSMKNYIEKCKVFFKINSDIRDYDIICDKLVHYDSSLGRSLVKLLKNQRNLKLGNARKIACGIQKLRLPQIDTERISESKLDKRFKKIVNNLNDRIKQNIPVVLNDEKKIVELHQLRKDFKKLRYVLESLSDKKKISQIITNLKKTQDMLGEIHDSDIMIDHLKTISKSHDVNNMLYHEKEQRTQQYNTFVQNFKKNELILRLDLS